jgi:hypothetical protein
MHDWQEIIREQLEPGALPPEIRAEIIAELAAHLEETYEEARARGLTESEALTRALQEVKDWSVLAADIQRAKSEETSMNSRTRNLWLPALASFAAASLFLLVLTRISLQPHFLVRLNSGLGPVFYLSWLFAQIPFGALGAYLSRRAGGTRAARVVAGIFPAIVMFGLWGVVIPVSAFAEHNTFVLQHPLSYALGILPLVVLPAIALTLGAAPFLRDPRVLKSAGA